MKQAERIAQLEREVRGLREFIQREHDAFPCDGGCGRLVKRHDQVPVGPYDTAKGGHPAGCSTCAGRWRRRALA